MAYREVSVVEVREVLRGWLGGAGLRMVAAQAGVDRKTAQRYVQAAEAVGVVRDGGWAQVTDDVVGAVVEAVRPTRPAGHGGAWPGMECQIDFGKIGPAARPGRGPAPHRAPLIFTAVYSRHMFVWLSFAQTLEAVIAGCEQAWGFFGAVFKVLIPDNMSAVVVDADSVNPKLTADWLDYAQHCGFVTDPARVRRAKDKPRVERGVQYVRSSCWAGETFVDLADAQARAQAWCARVAGQRVHGTIAARPADVFAEHEAGVLLPVPARYDVPVFKTCKVHRDYHLEIGKALYSVPKVIEGDSYRRRQQPTVTR
jgi:transposase